MSMGSDDRGCVSENAASVVIDRLIDSFLGVIPDIDVGDWSTRDRDFGADDDFRSWALERDSDRLFHSLFRARSYPLSLLNLFTQR